VGGGAPRRQHHERRGGDRGMEGVVLLIWINCQRLCQRSVRDRDRVARDPHQGNRHPEVRCSRGGGARQPLIVVSPLQRSGLSCGP
jgi:hypothetical protein